MNKENLTPAIVLLVSGLIVLGFVYFSKTKSATNTSPSGVSKTTIESNTSSDDKEISNSEVVTSKKQFTITGSNFAYDVKEIKVKKGDTVEVKFINADGFHDFVIDEFNAKTKQLKAPGEETITFIADKTGTFEYYCSVGSHKQMGMVGKLIVE
jgi:plastocyanin